MFSVFKISTFALALTPLVSGHIGLWHPSVLDFEGDEFSLAKPLSGMSFNQWWFHGSINKQPASSVAPLSLPAGKSVTVELSCNKKFTSYGSSPSSSSPCPVDFNSMHAATESELLGCGLAIAYKSKFEDVKPQDFTMFSVNHKCVQDIKTSFAVPPDMPACPSGGCICSWFWQGQNSRNEMYMTGFRCNVSGGSSTKKLGTPKPAKACFGSPSTCVTGPKQPMYWANDNSNIEWDGAYKHKPAYNANWGFANGAQTDIFATAGSADMVANTTKAGNETSSVVPTTLATVTKAAETKGPENCIWKGHCKGASCNVNQDCDGKLSCKNKICSQ